jgi:hypothetical protein
MHSATLPTRRKPLQQRHTQDAAGPVVTHNANRTPARGLSGFASHTQGTIEKAYSAFTMSAGRDRASGCNRPCRMSAPISFLRNSIVTHRKPLWRRSRWRRIRSAAAEIFGEFAAVIVRSTSKPPVDFCGYLQRIYATKMLRFSGRKHHA